MTEALEDGLADDPARYHAPDAGRGRPDGADGRRPLRAVPHPRRRARGSAPQPVALGDVVSEALAGADPVARARGVRLGGQVEEGVLVTADPAGLSRVVSNLLMNAIRHTPADGVVEVRGRAVPATGSSCRVTDACGGMSRGGPRPRLRRGLAGQPGAYAGPVDATGGAGAGLGLAIVKGIVEAHLGQVAVANHEPGCRFLVTLPA